jgi:hypothetical protein
MASLRTKLPSHRRGNPFKYSFTLGNGWTQAHFTGDVKFTLREDIPGSDVASNASAVAEASLADGEIVFTSSTEGYVELPSSLTRSWPVTTLLGELAGYITGAVPAKRTIEPLVEVEIEGDLDRS